jgi:hypothetical protein
MTIEVGYTSNGADQADKLGSDAVVMLDAGSSLGGSDGTGALGISRIKRDKSWSKQQEQDKMQKLRWGRE